MRGLGSQSACPRTLTSRVTFRVQAESKDLVAWRYKDLSRYPRGALDLAAPTPPSQECWLAASQKVTKVKPVWRLGRLRLAPGLAAAAGAGVAGGCRQRASRVVPRRSRAVVPGGAARGVGGRAWRLCEVADHGVG